MNSTVSASLQTTLTSMTTEALAQFAWLIPVAGAVLITIAVTMFTIRKLRGVARV